MKNSRKFRSDIAKKILATVLAGLSLTGGIQNVIAMKPIGNIQKNTLDKNNFWNESAQNSNKEFIKGYGNNESGILNKIEKFIVEDSVNFNDFNFNTWGFSSITDLDSNLKDGVKCRIGELKNEEKGFTKAIVFIMVPDNGILTEKHMDVIKEQLESQNLVTKDEDYNYYFSNVNFIIRSQSRSNKFEIGEKAICFCSGATINLQGANILGNGMFNSAINGCHKATINAQGATISGNYAIDWCEGATINAQGATISGNYAINGCKGAKINLEGATISARCAIDSCYKAIINLQGATISSVWAIYFCNKAIINLQGATISTENAIYDCDEAIINLQGATISAEYAICGCEGATINLQGATISAEKAICKCNKAIINLQGSTISASCWAIYGCEGATINLQGVKISRKTIIFDCSDSKIIVDKDKAYYVKWVVDESENIKINDTPIKDIVASIFTKKYTGDDIKLQFERFENIGGKYFGIDITVKKATVTDTLYDSIKAINDFFSNEDYKHIADLIKKVCEKTGKKFIIKMDSSLDENTISNSNKQELYIALNPKYFAQNSNEKISGSSETFIDVCNRCCLGNFWVPSDMDKCNKSIIYHELGHIIESAYCYVEEIDNSEAFACQIVDLLKTQIINKAKEKANNPKIINDEYYITPCSKFNSVEFFADTFEALFCCRDDGLLTQNQKYSIDAMDDFLKKDIKDEIKKLGKKEYKCKKRLYEEDIEKFENIADGKTFRVDTKIRNSEPYDALHMSIRKITDILTEYSVLSNAIKIIKYKLLPGVFWLKLVENEYWILASTYYDLSISLNDKYFGRYFDETIPEEDMSFKSLKLKNLSTGWDIPFDEDKAAIKTIAHEMGHILEFVYIYVKGMKKGKNTTHDVKMAKEIKDDIIAKARVSGEDCYISRYSKENDYEFFAECFAALQCCVDGRDSLDSGKKALIKATEEYINEEMIPVLEDFVQEHELEKFVKEHEPKNKPEEGCTIV